VLANLFADVIVRGLWNVDVECFSSKMSLSEGFDWMGCHIRKLSKSICCTDIPVKYMRSEPRATPFQEVFQQSCLINQTELHSVSAVAWISFQSDFS